jgi:D-alanyl-D-alanine carboxypeptidase (penicillin-binding protein 5/6)
MVDVNIDPSSVITKINLPEKVNAPVKEGDVLGNVTVILMGEEVATVDLVAMHDVKRSGLKYIGHVFGLVMKKPGFIIGSIVFVALVVFYGVLSVMYNNYKRRHRHYSRYR